MQDAMLEAGIAPGYCTPDLVLNNMIDFGWTIVSYMSRISFPCSKN